jgi:hypothetical protein
MTILEKKPMASVVIEDQVIPWSVIQRVRRLCGGDWDQTIDAFWKARGAKGKDGIIKYVLAGFRKGHGGNKYSLLPSKEANDGKMEMIRTWWRDCVYKPKPKQDTMNIKDVFRMLGA